jgi:hypothetical protein
LLNLALEQGKRVIEHEYCRVTLIITYFICRETKQELEVQVRMVERLAQDKRRLTMQLEQ